MNVVPPAPKKSAVVVPQPVRWHGRLAAWAIFCLVRLMSATVRYRWHDQSGLFQPDSKETMLFCIWHNRLSLCLELYRKYAVKQHPWRRMAALVSASKDGAMLARVLELFSVQPVRGSTSRRGPQALRELTTWAERGFDLAITPDGPRGPCYRIQEGIIALAQLTGAPILPVTYRLAWKIRVRSWDRFQIPLPFTRCDVYLAPPVRIPRAATEADRESLRQQLEQSLRALTED